MPDLALDADHLMPPLQDIVPPDSWESGSSSATRCSASAGLETKLLGYPRAPNGGDECSARDGAPKGTWRHLFTIGPDDEFGFEVADAGACSC